MAQRKIRSSSSVGTKTSRVTLNPRVARRSFLKLSAATAALTGAVMTTKMTAKAATPAAAKAAYPDSKNGTIRLYSLCGRLWNQCRSSQRCLD